VQLSCFPEGFRVLPTRRTPIDDAAAASLELTQFLAQFARRRTVARRSRGVPHFLVYRNHFRRPAEGGLDPFTLSAVKHTMTTLFRCATEPTPRASCSP
jgi:hypothetical protein